MRLIKSTCPSAHFNPTVTKYYLRFGDCQTELIEFVVAQQKPSAAVDFTITSGFKKELRKELINPEASP